MLKLNSSYSKKVPVEGQDFSSQSYHASVEVELPDGLTPDQLNARIHDTFDLVRRSVEAELRNGRAVPGPQAVPPAAARPAQPAPVSAKQVRFLTDLAVRRKLTLGDLNEMARLRYAVPGIEALSRGQASAFIDSLTADLNGAQQRRAA